MLLSQHRRIKLPKRTPIIIRVDGKAFHTLTRRFKRPWDESFIRAMNETALELCRQIQGTALAYVQSDEITLFVRNYDRYETSPWFDNVLQKMCSVSAAIATMAFNRFAESSEGGSINHNTENSHPWAGVYGTFDSRVFAVPREEVCNVFVDRQIDCIRNSKLGLGQHIIGKKKVHGMDQNDITEALLRDHDTDWEKEHTWHKFGRVIRKENVLRVGRVKSITPAPGGGISVGRYAVQRPTWVVMEDTPLFKDNRQLVDELVWPQDEEGNYSTYNASFQRQAEEPGPFADPTKFWNDGS